jgi:hypothetical protein
MPADPPPTPRAADLPEGSVVAEIGLAWIKGSQDWWYATGIHREHPYLNEEIDQRLAAGAGVLRVGTGGEGLSGT